MSDDIVDLLLGGAMLHPKRWSGDTHPDLGGSIDEAATNAVMREAAAEILTLRRDLAVQWRDWDEVHRLDALLSADGDTPDRSPNGDTP